MLEVTVRDYLANRVKAHGGICELFTSPGKRFVPDCIVMWDSAVLHFVETKTKGGRLSPGQIRDHERRQNMGFHVYVPWCQKDVDNYIALCIVERWARKPERLG